ncbi:MAG: fibronectin type III domain-containing protein [Patescibacteria group bacterium]|mgnify:FL=1
MNKNNFSRIVFISFIVIAVLFVSRTTNAAVNLPWSTTYNCANWTQSNGLYNVNCDGLTGGGSWTTADGKEEQITAAANYPAGGGGKGQRSWNGDGINNNSGGTHISFNSSYSELWIRWYMRYETGYTWNPLNHDKILIVNVNQPGYVVVMFSWADEVAVEVNGNRYGSGVGNGWNTVMANGGTDSNGNKTSDGQWHLYELHLIKDTNGSNGVAEWWIDGVKRLSRNDVPYGTFSGWGGILIASNQNSPSNGRSVYIDYDDMVISTSGPIGGGVDAQAPSVPAGLTAQAVSNNQINLSWTASTDNIGITGYRIYRCQGTGCVPTVQIATSTANSYSNIGLTASTAYTYGVSAYDAAGNTSGQSSSAGATTQVADTTPPASPTGLTVM